MSHGYMRIRDIHSIHGIQYATTSIMARRPELCPVEATARIVGGRWKAAVLDQLFQGTKRFSELKRGITGITQRTLAQQLRELQSTGIVERTVYPDRPPRVVYAITPHGGLSGYTDRSTIPVLCSSRSCWASVRWVIPVIPRFSSENRLVPWKS